MTKADLVAAVASKAGLTKAEAAKAVDAVFEAVSEELAKGGKVSVVGFGTFAAVRRAPRKARNIRTGGVVDVPGRVVPVFRPGDKLKAAVAGS